MNVESAELILEVLARLPEIEARQEGEELADDIRDLLFEIEIYLRRLETTHARD